MDHPSFEFNPGHRLDSFEIVEPLYAGALAQVYRGVDTMTRQSVAIKVPSLDIINHPLVYYHFQNEVRVLAKVEHPRIVRCIHRDRSSAYSVFEYVPGMDLRKRMNVHGRFSLDKARHYIAQIAQGLSYLHNCGIIHLDVKPENMIITPMDTVKIVDFGLARQLGTPDVLKEDFTRPHGTPYYAAPEQLMTYRDDTRTDQYSLAVVLYELLTGQLPFEKSTDLARVKKRLKIDPVPPRHYRSDLSHEIQDVILKALSRQPEDRYTSVLEFVRALEGGEGAPLEVKTQPVQTEGGTAQTCPIPTADLQGSARPYGVVAALDDNDKADAVVTSALREVMAKGTTVTLLTVVAGDNADEWTRYGDQVKGNRWGQRLESFARQFRHYGFDPVVRIRTGTPSKEIVEMATATQADLIIMGPSSKNLLKRMFGAATLNRVLKKAPCRVKVAAEPVMPSFPMAADPAALTAEDLVGIDYFLVALWTQQLNWLAALMQALLSEPLAAQDLTTEESPMTAWVKRVQPHERWAFLVQGVKPPLEKLHHTVEQMVTAMKTENRALLRERYLEGALPLLCRLRERIQKISGFLREQSTLHQIRQARLLEDPHCPLDQDTGFAGGPIRQIQAIREYFCAHPDASPATCLRWLDEEKAALPTERGAS